jgi:hypothetical protein
MHVGMVGIGRIGPLHAQTLKQSPLVSRLTVVDADEKRAASVAGALGAEQAASVEDLIREGVDAWTGVAAAMTSASLTVSRPPIGPRSPDFSPPSNLAPKAPAVSSMRAAPSPSCWRLTARYASIARSGSKKSDDVRNGQPAT